jgi:non-heme chloroperoxidase
MTPALQRRQALTVMTGIGAIVAGLPPGVVQAAPTPVRRGVQIVARDGTRLFHRDWGEGRPVVFMAGWGLPSECWAYQAAALSEEGLRCIAYDRRGHGRSDAPWKGYDHDTLADDLAAVLEQLDLRDVVLVAPPTRPTTRPACRPKRSSSSAPRSCCATIRVGWSRTPAPSSRPRPRPR